MATIHHDSSKHIFIAEVQGHQAAFNKLLQFTHSSTKAAAIMLVAAIIALIVANTPAYDPFIHFWHQEYGFVFMGQEYTMSLAHIINDIFMAVFFLLVGLEVKYEMTVGELTNIRQALLPIMGAVGGVLAPIVIYSIFNANNPATSHGWGVPTATDIAFALGILALLGDRVPAGVRVFLSTLAVADDIIAILVIAIFYGQSPSLLWLGLAGVVLIMLIILNRAHVYSLYPYMILGVVLWYCVFMSGVHSTIAGVLLAFTIPSGSRVNLHSFISWSHKTVNAASRSYAPETPVIAQGDYIHTVEALSKVSKQVIPPATRLEHMLYPWVYFAILPVFALTNADVSFQGMDMGLIFTDPVFYGVFLGLLLGKPIGITLMSLIVVKTKLASLPENVNWIHMIGAGILGGVGFTMAIFVANLAFTDEMHIATAKLGILLASALAGIIGFLFLMIQAKSAQKGGVHYLETAEDAANVMTAELENTRKTDKLIATASLETLDNPDVRARVEAAKQRTNVFHIAVDLGPTGLLGGGSVKDVRDAIMEELARVLREEGRDDLFEKVQAEIQEDRSASPMASMVNFVLQDEGEEAFKRTITRTEEDEIFERLVRESEEQDQLREEEDVEGMSK